MQKLIEEEMLAINGGSGNGDSNWVDLVKGVVITKVIDTVLPTPTPQQVIETVKEVAPQIVEIMSDANPCNDVNQLPY